MSIDKQGVSYLFASVANFQVNYKISISKLKVLNVDSYLATHFTNRVQFDQLRGSYVFNGLVRDKNNLHLFTPGQYRRQTDD
jgi:hypothetical protein